MAAGRGGCGCSFTCRCRAGSDCAPIDGGVSEPLVGVVLWLDSLESSADLSVLKLALDRRRKSLKFKNDRGMAGMAEPFPALTFGSQAQKGTSEWDVAYMRTGSSRWL
jgi:hypothetical protein